MEATLEMKQLLEDSLKLASSFRELLLAPTSRGRLHTLVRLCRPNWSSRRCFKALAWMRRNGMRAASSFASVEEYQAHLHSCLVAYAAAHPVRRVGEVADEVTLSRWESRWRRVRNRQRENEVTESESGADLSSAA